MESDNGAASNGTNQNSSGTNGSGLEGELVAMEKELNVLRKVAKAAKAYQEMVIRKRSLQLLGGMDPNELQRTMLEIGSAEFQLSEALNEWYRATQPET